MARVFFRGRNRTSKDKGNCHGVLYDSRATTNDYYGRYECHIGRKLIDVPGTIFESKPFAAAKQRWVLRLSHRQDGQVLAFLQLDSDVLDEKNIEVHTSFEVANFDPLKSTRRGFTTTFSPKEQSGTHLLYATAMTDPHGGFLKQGKLTIVVELRVVLPQNEWQTFMRPELNAPTITWKLKNLNQSTPWVMHSRPFHVGEHEWKIQLFPHGLHREGESAALYLATSGRSEVDWKVKITAENCMSPEQSISRDTLRHTEGRGLVCGSARFMPTVALEDESVGFLRDGYFTIKVDFYHAPETAGQQTEEKLNQSDISTSRSSISPGEMLSPRTQAALGHTTSPPTASDHESELKHAEL